MKAILFDFDGTLANTLPVSFYAFQQVFNTYDGKDLSDEDVKNMFGPPEPEIIRGNLQHADKEKAVDLFLEIYEKNHKALVEPNQEVTDMIQKLKERGYKLAIITGKSRASLDISLKALEMDEALFDAIVTGDDVVNAKPNPEGILNTLRDMNIEKSEAMFIGDSNADIEAGKQAGVTTVGVQWLPEFQSSEFTMNPDKIYKKVSEFTQSFG
ncbi:pyrophosphatase PpaX [Oceanobacillus picturae]|uniref:Pyrophosphatase PpaX n=1 Tax=Oceanobacillus picturae TaxID=171693 RepID=A0A0U9H711_9BACI|nr:HAD family hydrolase [Oceanobacillus picturae]GAQ18271.1 pyrophosphatase PpaX [Oceanobacillus picturae]